jgi:ComF family protein
MTAGSPDCSPWRKALPTAARHWLGRAASWLPGACALCAATGRHVLCPACTTDFFPAPVARCRRCALPLPAETNTLATLSCGTCLRQPPAFDATVVAADYTAPLDRLVLGLKFGGRLALAPLFSQTLRDALLRSTVDDTPLPDHLTAVPLGAERLRTRGFNQALEIARPLSAALGVPLAPRLLVRVRETTAQSMLSPPERRLNLRDAFTLQPAMLATVCGRHIGVVDDVMTTGATLDAVASVLKRFGAVRVTNLVFARTPPGRV